MLRLALRLFSVAVLSLPLPASALEGPLYGMGSSGTLYEIDPNDASLTARGATGLQISGGMDVHPQSGRLWVAAHVGQDLVLHSIDPVTLAVQAELTITNPNASETRDLAFLPNGDLYALGWSPGSRNGTRLFVIDASTGAMSLTNVDSGGFVTANLSTAGLKAFDAGTLLADSGRDTIDLTTGPPHPLTQDGSYTGELPSKGTQMAYAADDNETYVIRGCFSGCGGEIYRVDRDGRTGTLLGTPTDMSGSVFLNAIAVPEPALGGAAIAVLSTLALLRRRRMRPPGVPGRSRRQGRMPFVVAGALLLHPSVGQAGDLRDAIIDLYGGDGIRINAIAHEAHFEPTALAELTALNDKIAESFSTQTPSSTVAAFVFDTNLGVFIQQSESLGPIFADRPQTLGAGKINFSFGFTSISFDSFEGESLNSLRVEFPHTDCCDTPSQQPNPDGELDGFELDVVGAIIDVDLRQKIFSFSVAYGVTENWELSLIVPVVETELRASAFSIVEDRSGTGLHFFGPEGGGFDAPTSTSGGTAVGIGDVLLRSKYQFLDPEEGDWRPDLAWIAQTRIPSGDADDLLGSGDWAFMFWLVSSRTYGRVTPHLNAGYEISGGDAGFDNLRWIAGVDVRVFDWLTGVAEFTGRHELRQNDGIGDHQYNAVLGYRVNPWRTFALSSYAQIAANRDSGLRDNVIWGGSVEFTF